MRLVLIGQKLFLKARFRLNLFHVARAIKGVLGWTKQSYKVTKEALLGNLSTSLDILDKVYKKANDNKLKKITKVKRYLKNSTGSLKTNTLLAQLKK